MRRALVVAAICALTLAGCAGAGAKDGNQTLTVLAASSLSGTFTDLATQFERSHPGVRVRLVLDSSATLAQMAREHAPGDVLATADRRTIDQAAAGGGLGGTPTQFASNVVVLAVPRDNPAKITSVSDLDKGGVDYLTCVASAPCGAAAHALLQAEGITRTPVSEEVDVKAVLTKVEADEADAGLVYRTDVTATKGKVTALEVPGANAQPNTYWVAPTAASTQSRLARAWIELLTGPDGRAVLSTAGFGTP
jgi:molybdate transport system substrate-binding protein